MSKALDQFMSSYTEVENRLEKLVALCEDHFQANPENMTWGEVSEIEAINDKLKELCVFAGLEEE